MKSTAQVLSRTDGSTTTITIQGKFTFDAHALFRDSYKSVERQPGHKFVVDVRQVEYLDSSALGMLLQLREFNQNQNVSITSVGEAVEAVFKVAQFGKLFALS